MSSTNYCVSCKSTKKLIRLKQRDVRYFESKYFFFFNIIKHFYNVQHRQEARFAAGLMAQSFSKTGIKAAQVVMEVFNDV